MNTSESLPQRLLDLGLRAVVLDGIEVIEPPICNVPAGAFVMGVDSQSSGQGHASEYESPQHIVTLAAFDIARFPVTVAEYACAVNVGAVREPLAPEWDWGGVTWGAQRRHPDNPVVCVTWKDARQYAAWLSRLTGCDWRLPAEAEWEKAARGADGRIFPWGNQWDGMRTNTSDNGPGRLTPIGMYPQGSSPYDVECMAGNVYEWCSSHFAPYPYRTDDGREDDGSEFGRVMRGGCWSVDLWHARTTGRNANDEPFDAFSFTGFRLVRSVA